MPEPRKESLATSEEHQKYVTQWKNEPFVSLGPGLKFHVVTAERMTAIFTELEPNAMVPYHKHEPEQLLIVTGGDGEQVLYGKRFPIKPGDVMVVPGNEEHALYVGPKGINTIEVFSPPRRDYEAKLAEVKKQLKK